VSDAEILSGSLVAELSTPIEYVAVPAFTEILASPDPAWTTEKPATVDVSFLEFLT